MSDQKEKKEVEKGDVFKGPGVIKTIGECIINKGDSVKYLSLFSFSSN
jgi:hypothetical protein